MQNRFIWYRSATIIIIAIVIISVIFSALIAGRLVTVRLSDYFQKRNASDLHLASDLGLQICEQYFEELLELRLSDDVNMLATMRKESLSGIADLSAHYSSIGLAVVENGTELIFSTLPEGSLDDGIFGLPKKFPEDSEIHTLENGTIIRWNYFPFWRWHVISMLTAEDAMMPVRFVQYIIVYSLSAILSVFIVSFLLVFRIRIHRPLRMLTDTAEKVRGGLMQKTGLTGRDEIGIASEAFDNMVDSLSVSIDELRRTSEIKDTLLMEVHHRVRNNLNIITSILNLKLDTLEDKRLVEVFEDSKNRIMTIALIHGQIYDSGDFESLSMERFIRDIVFNIRTTYDGDSLIRVDYDVEDLKIDMDAAVTLGLLINEIITNSYKYAFEGAADGIVSIMFRASAKDYFLEIRDNGPGLPSGKSELPGTTLGFNLIYELTLQLQGSVELLPGEGVGIRIVFPANDNKQ